MFQEYFYKDSAMFTFLKLLWDLYPVHILLIILLWKSMSLVQYISWYIYSELDVVSQ